jgi:hypothetical protein
LISALNVLHRLIKIVLVHVTSKIIVLLSYLVEDERELSLGMLDTSQTYLLFLMLHACLCTISFVFCYTLWCFYAFSRTNLLTRCHSVSSLFSVVFVFHKSYRRHRHETKAEVPIFPTRDGVQSTDGGGQRVAAPCHGAGHPLAAPGYGMGPWSTP